MMERAVCYGSRNEDSLSESEVSSETVVIPGQFRLSNPAPPPTTVPLPIVAQPHVAKNVWLGLFMLFSSLVTLPLAAFLAFVAPVAFGAIETWTTLRGGFAFLFVLAGFAIFLFWGVGCLGAALTCFRDAMRRGSALEITAQGVQDYRSGLAIPWSDVRCARLLYDSGGSASVDLQLRASVACWQSPFRAGVWMQRYRPKPDHVIISAAYLDVRGHILAFTILTLVEANGGRAVTKAGYAGDGQRLIPRASVKPVV
jgi:hypothetical protein